MTASLLPTAAVAFAGTTIDDLVILSALFMAGRVDGTPRAVTIIAGQFAGFVAILGVALLAATGLQIVPDRWVGLLGLVPIGFGVWGLWRLRGSDEDSRPTLATSVGRIGMITFANGADNISVFTPLFRSAHLTGSLLTIGLFLVLIAVWCALGAFLGSRKAIVATLGRISHLLVPAVFVSVGAFILITSGTPAAIREML